MALKKTQTDPPEHSEAKVELLNRYIQRYISILNLSPYTSRIHIYDLFCGPGIHENETKGSPVITLETIKNNFFKDKASGRQSTPVDCYFSDNDPSKIDSLRESIANKHLHYPEMGRLEIICSDYREQVGELIKNAASFGKNDKCFAFIDPYGYSDVDISDIGKILECGKTEVLLWLPTQFMYRFESKATPGSLEAFLNGIAPEGGWKKSHSGLEFIDRLKTSLYQHFDGKYYVDSFVLGRGG